MANGPLTLDFDRNSSLEGEDVSLKTILRYLVGSQSAILDLATNPRTVWLGLLLVVSAGIAREWDNKSLLREPWHLLLPLLASLGTSFVLFILVYVLALHRGAVLDRFWTSYRTFLGLYWLTAPLAWIYATPVERFLSPYEAGMANLVLLSIVSLWRVILIVRVIVVLFHARTEAVLPIVLLFADSVVLFLVATFPRPVIEVMGGMQSQQTEVTVREITAYVGIWGTLTYPLWLLGCLAVFSSTEPEWVYAAAKPRPSQRIHRSVWIVAWASILSGLCGIHFRTISDDIAVARIRIDSGLHSLPIRATLTLSPGTKFTLPTS